MAQGREPGMEYGMAYDSPYLEDETHHLPAEPTGGRHELNTVHLVAGLVMLGIVVVWLLERFDLVPTGDLEYLLPVPFLLAGGLGLLAWVLTGRRSG